MRELGLEISTISVARHHRTRNTEMTITLAELLKDSANKLTQPKLMHTKALEGMNT